MPTPDGPVSRARTYTAGFADALGERQLVFDSGAGMSLEILRFKKEFSDNPEFEIALRARVEEINHLQHPSLAAVHVVERVEGLGLSLISRHTAGRRVSELLPKAHGPAFALELIRLVTPALATLQRAGDDVSHGVLSADRIVVTRDGRLVVVEHVLGSAIEALQLPRARLMELGIVAPAGSDPIHFDGRTDIIQLGFIALSLLLGRRLDAADYPEKVPALLDEFAQGTGSPILSTKMRVWLERALQISSRSFSCARDAVDGFSELPDDVDVKVAESARGLLAFPAEAVSLPGAGAKTSHDPASPGHAPDEVRHRDAARTPAPPVPRSARSFGRVAVWAIGVVGLLAIGAGVALVVVPYVRPAAAVVEVHPPSAPATNTAAVLVPPATPAATTEPPLAIPNVAPAVAAPGPTGVVPAAAATPAPVPAGPRFGGLTVTSSIDLQVFKDGQLVGSTAGPIAVNEGSQNLEFVNESLGFRYRQTVNVKNGQMTSVKIAVPNGHLSINAVPWADVTIDGTPSGETPLANLSLPIGTHEIVFKHPQLGERRQTVVVKAEGLLRVTQTFQQEKY